MKKKYKYSKNNVCEIIGELCIGDKSMKVFCDDYEEKDNSGEKKLKNNFKVYFYPLEVCSFGIHFFYKGIEFSMIWYNLIISWHEDEYEN